MSSCETQRDHRDKNAHLRLPKSKKMNAHSPKPPATERMAELVAAATRRWDLF
jgi:hypothetical protein